MITLSLFSKHDCLLCHEMEAALRPLLTEFSACLVIIDIEADPRLLAAFSDRIPVLRHNETELAHYVLEIPRIRDYLSKIR